MDFQDVIELVEAGATVVIQRTGKPDIVMASGQRNPDQVIAAGQRNPDQVRIKTSGQRNPDFEPIEEADQMVISRVRRLARQDGRQ
jgi:hypothetical protein